MSKRCGCLNGIGLPLEVQGDGVAPVEERRDHPAGGFTDEYGSGFCLALQSGRGVQRISCGRVRDVAARALGAEDRETRLDADPHREPRQSSVIHQLQAVCSHVIRYAEAGEDRPLRVVLVRNRSTEDTHRAITCDIRDHATE